MTRFLKVVALMTLVWALATAPAAAAVPTTLQMEGVLTSAGGGPAADGNYAMTFTIYKTEAAKDSVWQEAGVTVAVQGGHFAHGLGSKTPLGPAALTGLTEAWLGVQVEGDPALAPRPLRSVPFALRAGLAEGLECSGCVGVGQLDASVLAPFAKKADLAKIASSGAYADLSGLPDLAPYAKAAALAKIATSGAYADLIGAPDLAAYAKLAGLADVAKSGAYADLEGLPVVPKVGVACGTGLMVNGIQADGALLCLAAMDPQALPPGGLDEISNGLLSNQFKDIVPSTTVPADILDNNPQGMTDSIVVPDLGLAENLTISLKLTNSDIAFVHVAVTDPAGKVHVLYDKSAKGTALAGTWPSPQKPVSGDLAAWIGKNPKGKWTIQVTDTGFVDNGKDGKLEAWSVEVSTLSNQKIESKGVLLASGGFQLPVSTKATLPCDAAHFGYMYASTTDKAVYICNGKDYYPIALVVVGTKENPSLHCKDQLAKAPLSKSGVYWIDPDGTGALTAFQAYCDMTSDGGGWTLVWSNTRGGTGKTGTKMTWTTAIDTPPLVKGTMGENLEAFTVYTGLKHWMSIAQGKQLRYSWANDFGSPVDQSYRCQFDLNASANYTITFSGCAQLVGSTAPGLVTYHKNRPFSTFDKDSSAGCATTYGQTPWWYDSCWDGSIQGGGETEAGGHKNGAYWSGSAAAWGADNGTGGGNGWIFVR